MKMNIVTRRVLFGAALLSLAVIGSACTGQGIKGAGGTSGIENVDDMGMGNKDAQITIIEYASFTCPHCATFHQTVFEEIKAKYIDTGKVRFVFRQMPTPPARLAVGGEAIARCKGDSRTYFEMLDILFEKQMVWLRSSNPGQSLRDIASTAGISTTEFDTCVSDRSITERIQQSSQHAYDTWGFTSTPSFVINGEYYDHLATMAGFEAIIDPMLASPETGTGAGDK